jgi:hypothetical protein
MYEEEIIRLFSEIHSPAFGSEVDKALKSSRLNEMKARAVVREVAQKAEADNLPASEFVSQTIAALYGQQVTTQAPTKIAAPDLSDRRSTNRFLREHGYKWSKMEALGQEDGEYIWVLHSPNGRAVTAREALAEIGVR